MSKVIKLQNGIVEGMKVEVGRGNIAVRIVCGALNRGKVVNIILRRDNNHPARMLPSRPLDAGAAGRKPGFLCLMNHPALFFQVF